MNPTNPVGWFEIYVTDMDRAAQFYETVLQHKLAPLPDAPAGTPLEMRVFAFSRDRYGIGGALVKMEGVHPGGSTLVYFSCDDCAKEAARVVPAGGALHRPKFSIGHHGFIALVSDTEGNMFGLHSMT